MHLASLLTADQIVPAMRARTHAEAIEELIGQLVATGVLPEDLRAQIVSQLISREELVSTGIGGGVAIPHTFSEHLPKVIAILGRSPTGIDFDALDAAPVHLVVLFLVPRRDYNSHLRILAAIAKMLANAGIRQRISDATSPDEILAILDVRLSRASTPKPPRPENP